MNCPQHHRQNLNQLLSSADPDLPSADRAPEHALLNHAFQVTESLNYKPMDYHKDGRSTTATSTWTSDLDWEVKAGCFIRYCLVPRRHKMCLHDLPRDSPFSSAQLDQIRVTVMYDHNGKSHQLTDDGTDSHPMDRTWTGLSIFQIKGDLRREMTMYAKAPLQGARQLGKTAKMQHAKTFKKDRIRATSLTPDERAQFKAAKVKELQSLFDNQVWQFETTRRAKPDFDKSHVAEVVEEP